MLQLLETVPQDIKTQRDYKPCAPASFRWIMIGIYVSLLLGALVYGGFLLGETGKNSMAEKGRQQLADVQKKISEVQAKGSQNQQLRNRFEQWQSFLMENYSLSSFFNELFLALPEGMRLLDLSFEENNEMPGMFLLKMRFFSKGENEVPDTQEFEDKLTLMGAGPEGRQKSVAENGRMEIETIIRLPERFYPARRQEGESPTDMHNRPFVRGEVIR